MTIWIIIFQARSNFEHFFDQRLAQEQVRREGWEMRRGVQCRREGARTREEGLIDKDTEWYPRGAVQEGRRTWEEGLRDETERQNDTREIDTRVEEGEE